MTDASAGLARALAARGVADPGPVGLPILAGALVPFFLALLCPYSKVSVRSIAGWVWGFIVHRHSRHDVTIYRAVGYIACPL